MLKELLDEMVSSSRRRCNPRGVKRKMSGWTVRNRTLKCNARTNPVVHVVGLK